ncbi:XPG/RAD2 endonuclease [Penicillium atrosanguineum]|uniref:XPG/RAD2 endonuclease n=1 Tax=Penicillium atrosanguineum TaxID=1132637 RepID=A0A9W9PRH1_9EURO|nr:XPG/RAD2 endonuclease [Penicillium atrosanguineum]
MGVTGLWTVVQPCARPIKLETLNKKRLAVDASIWIYQFLKAVRDKEGNALRNSHVVGFFRRICKLLYFGIRPVFVFDGGAPVLKRQTIAGRKKRREGRREDATRTAGKLLAVQMQRSAEEEAEQRRRNRDRIQETEEAVPDAPLYADETLMTEQEKQKTRKFKKKDAYHLPNLDVSLEQMGAPNDPRIMSQDELEEYARQFHQGQDINLYDFSKIDFDSPFFLSLPASDRYNILNAARLRSRMRMGYSQEQLDIMFPNRMDFSRFQIERVKERNDLTQRLMNINGMNGEEAFYNSGQRIAGERGREYVLVQDSEHAGGWVLGVVGNKNEGYEDKPIDVDTYGLPEALSGSEASDDEEFEDVPIEGLNRLPKLPFLKEGVFDQSLHQEQEDADIQRALFKSHQNRRDSIGSADDDELFVRDENTTEDFFNDDGDDDLERAIALSMQPNEAPDEDLPDISINRATDTTTPLGPMEDLSESDDDGMDFSAAIAQTKVSKKPQAANPFSGPLPFEPITLNKSTKPAPPAEVDEDAGGFIKEPTKKKKTDPLPPWFVGERLNQEFIVDRPSDDRDDATEHDRVVFSNRRSPDIIDIDKVPDTKEVVDLDELEEKETEAKAPIEIIPDVEETKPKSPEVEALEEPVGKKSPTEELPTKSTSEKEEEPEAQSRPPQAESSPEPEFEDVGQAPAPGLETTVVADQHKPNLNQTEEANVPKQPFHVEPSPEPDFEDVLAQPPTQAPEIIVISDQHPKPQVELTRPDQFVEDDVDFSDPEDEDLMQQLAAESEEHVRFAQTLNSAAPIQDTFDYEQELKQLRNQQRKDRRDADEVTQIMINECQQLLTLFGLPYVTAPMEAEAQCAELVSLGLVDGIVTDDSDIFLFGGTRVYKNMFNQSKFVECYLTSDFEKEYALHRRKLISFAHLLGSDYTEGIPGVGPVTALEIITEFSSLEEFRDWWGDLQMGVNKPDDPHQAFRKKFRKKASKIFLAPSFPDTRVDEAYLEPEVDSDPSQFQWGIPDLNGLRHFLMATIGWSQERTDEILVPVIRDMNRREQEGTQSNITQFMQGPQGAGAFAPRVRGSGPSRMEQAFNRLQQQAQGADRSGEAEEGSGSRGKRGASKGSAKGPNKKRKT